MYRSVPLVCIPPNWFEDIPTAEELGIDPEDAASYDDTSFTWEHANTLTSKLGMVILKWCIPVHAIYDIHVHTHDVQCVTLRFGYADLRFTQVGHNHWTLTTFTRTRPLIWAASMEDIIISMRYKTKNPVVTLRFCCHHLKQSMVDMIEDGCYMNGPGRSKFVFLNKYFAHVENPEKDDKWND